MTHQFKVGDKVKFIAQVGCRNEFSCIGTRIDGGKVVRTNLDNAPEITKTGTDNVNFFGKCDNYFCHRCIFPFDDSQLKEVDMNSFILDVYDKTSEAKLVNKWFGTHLDPKNLFQCLVFKSLSILILAEANRLEDEAKLENK